MKTVVDSNFLIAFLDTKDVWHKRAEEIDFVLPESVDRVFLDVVLVESLTVFARRSEERKQVDSFLPLASSLTAIVPKEKIVWLCPGIPNEYESIIDLMR